MKKKILYQFKIELFGITPSIWRRIEVPSTYTFWDLHVAIQDSMGWLDYHLHNFDIVPPNKKESVTIGIPDEFDDTILPCWEIPIVDYFVVPGDDAIYNYDFGDRWQHEVILEGMHLQQDRKKYPKCTDGENACPPEDCGGIPGYYQLLEILNDPKHEEYKTYVDWLKKHAKNYHPFKPNYFEVKKVKFDNPEKRFEESFET